MTKLKFVLLSAVMALTLTACEWTQEEVRTFTLDVASLTASLATFERDLSYAESAVERNSGLYTEGELVSLRMIRERIQAMRGHVKALMGDQGGLAEVVIAADQAQYILLDAKLIYEDAKAIVMPHLAEMSTADQQYLIRLDLKARSLNERLTRLNMMPDGTNLTSTLSDLLALAGMVARATR